MCEVAATEKIEMIEYVVEVIEVFAHRIAGIDRKRLAVCSIEVFAEAAEQFRHGEIGLAIAVIGRGIENHGLPRSIEGDISRPQVAVQQ
ncbi:hypothetical protein D3C83_05080 [compost metagenome]